MRVWRLCRRPYADLSGQGGRLVSGRWHSAGRPVIYTAYEPALAILEVRVHLDLPFEDLPLDYVMMEIDLTALGSPIPIIDAGSAISDPRAIGDGWLSDASSPVLGVPSILAPRGWNYLINPLHPRAASIAIRAIEDFEFDARLWNVK